MPPSRSRPGLARLGILSSLATMAGGALFAFTDAVAPQSEPILVGGSVAGIGLVCLFLAREIIATRDMVRETHNGLFNEHTGVFTVLATHERRADRHSLELQEIRDGAD